MDRKSQAGFPLLLGDENGRYRIHIIGNSGELVQ